MNPARLGEVRIWELAAEAHLKQLDDSQPQVAGALRARMLLARRGLDRILSEGAANDAAAETGVDLFEQAVILIIGLVRTQLGDKMIDLSTLPADHPLVKDFHLANGVFQNEAVLSAAAYLESMPGRHLKHNHDVTAWKDKYGRFLGGIKGFIKRPRAHSESTTLAAAGRKFLLDHHGVIFMETDKKGLKAPLRHSRMPNLGMFSRGLRDQMEEVFPSLDYDNYDVRRAWIEAIQKYAPSPPIERLKSFYAGDIDLEALSDLVRFVPHEERARVEKMQPWRRRAIANFRINQEEGLEPVIERFKSEDYVQPSGDEVRSWPRRFKELNVDVEASEQFQELLSAIFSYVKRMDNTVEEMEVTSHFMGLVARAGQEASNAPEGPHQDGADYSITALVVERNNVKGGESIVYVKDRKGKLNEVYRATLKPGEFIFQADESAAKNFGQDNDYYHTVTPIAVEDLSRDGVRNIIGFDIKVTKRSIQ